MHMGREPQWSTGLCLGLPATSAAGLKIFQMKHFGEKT